MIAAEEPQYRLTGISAQLSVQISKLRAEGSAQKPRTQLILSDRSLLPRIARDWLLQHGILGATRS